MLITTANRFLPAIGFLRVCYFPGWAYNRNSTFARFGVSNVEADVCTHLIYAFGRIDQLNKVLLPPESDEESRYHSFNELKNKNSALRTLLSIGGQNDHGEGFVAVSQTDALAVSFASSVVVYLRKYGFDGLDIDWEYPNSNTNQNFILILKSLRAAFDQDTRSPRLLLTVAAPAGSGYITQGFHVPEINRYVDYVSIMAYDFVDAKYSNVTNFNSPLYSRNSVAFNQEYSLNWTVHHYSSLGLQPDKILIGVSGTGKWLVLNNTSRSVPGSSVVKGSLRNSSDYYITGGIAYAEDLRNKHKDIVEFKRAARYGQLNFTEELIRELGNIGPFDAVPIASRPPVFFKHAMNPEFMDKRGNCRLCYSTEKVICKVMLTKANTKVVFDDQQKATYLVNGDNWITYDDVDTIKEKTKWAVKSGLAGVMFWSLDQDDFSGKGCNKGTYPLVKSMRLATDNDPSGAAVHPQLNYFTIYVLLMSVLLISVKELM
ncbi:Endochitinase 1 [Bulinus truncatus]|nr:Endochitinase 1 [Bulinus truncatus]